TTGQVDSSRSQYRVASERLFPLKRRLDIYAGQFFSEGKASHPRLMIEFLQSDEAQSLFQAKDQREFESSSRLLPEVYQRLVRRSLIHARENRFFHWELEFPEAFFERGQKSYRRLDDP